MPTKLPVIKVVGVSASGKSTLVKQLRNAGYDARPISQEHSSVPDLWKQFELPKILIFLDVTLTAQQQRRPDVAWDENYRRDELQKLRHAIEHAELRIDTTDLSPEIVSKVAISFLQQQRVRHADAALPPVQATGSALPTG